MSKVNIILGALLLAQLAFLGIDRFVVGEAHRPRVTVKGERLFPKLVPDAVVQLDLRRDRGDVRLVRGASGWVVASEDDALADETMVRTALVAMAGLAPGPVVSENAANHVDFGVAGGEAIEVVARDAAGTELARFVLGTTTSDWRGAYVRWPHDADEVMLVPGNVRTSFDKAGGRRGAWRDKTILTGDPLAVRTVTIDKPDAERIVLERQLLPSTEEGREGELLPTDQDDWILVAPTEGLISRYAGNSMAATLADLEADGFHFGGESLEKLGFAPAVARVEATLADDRKVILEIGAEADARRYVRVSGQDDVFVVPSYRLFGFLEEAVDMVKPR